MIYPVLFKPLMVQSILNGTKTQTRRIIKPQPDDDGLHNHTTCKMSLDSELEGWLGTVDGTGESKQFPWPGQKGDILYIREQHWAWGKWVKNGISNTGKQKLKFISTGNIRFDDPKMEPRESRDLLGWHKRSSLFLPKEHSRLFLELTDVYPERLLDISEEDAISEGIEYIKGETPPFAYKSYLNYKKPPIIPLAPVISYKTLWINIHGYGSWESNPWVWVKKFKVIDKPANWPQTT